MLTHSFSENPEYASELKIMSIIFTFQFGYLRGHSRLMYLSQVTDIVMCVF